MGGSHGDSRTEIIRYAGRRRLLRDLGQELGCGSPARLFLEIEVAELLAVGVLHNECGADVLNRPGRREAAQLTLPAVPCPIPFSGRQHSSLGATEALHSDRRTKAQL